MLYMFLAEGFEETECVATADMLRRGGIECSLCSLDGKSVKGAHGISVEVDITLSEISESDITGIILPGGMPGTINLENNKKLSEIIDKNYSAGKLTAAICAAPAILLHKGILNEKKATVYPSFKDEMISGGAYYYDSSVVADGNIITASGPHAAIDFGLKIVEYFKGVDVANQIRLTL